MSSSDSFLEVAKSIQDTYMGGSLQGQLYALEKLKSHIEFQIKDVQARIDERSDKSYATQVYYCMSIGATRMEEEKVVEIKCHEA